MFGEQATGFYIRRGTYDHFVEPIRYVASLTIDELRNCTKNPVTYERYNQAYHSCESVPEKYINVKMQSKNFELYSNLDKSPRGIFNVDDAAKTQMALFWNALDHALRNSHTYPIWTAGYSKETLHAKLNDILTQRDGQMHTSTDSSQHDGRYVAALLMIIMHIREKCENRPCIDFQHANGQMNMRLDNGMSVVIDILGLFTSGHSFTYTWNTLVMQITGWTSDWVHHGRPMLHGCPLIMTDVISSGDDTDFIGPGSVPFAAYYAKVGFELKSDFADTTIFAWLSKFYYRDVEGVSSFRSLGKLMFRSLYQVNESEIKIHDWSRYLGKLRCYHDDSRGIPIAQAFIDAVVQATKRRVKTLDHERIIADSYKHMRKDMRYVYRSRGYATEQQVVAQIRALFNFYGPSLSLRVDDSARLVVQAVYGISITEQQSFEREIVYLPPAHRWPLGAILVPRRFSEMLDKLRQDV